MLNSLLMLGSTNKKMKKINYVSAIIWIGYMLLNANLKTGLIFTIVNLVVFLSTFALGQVVKGKYSNIAISIFSIIIWSVLIDIISFYMYPQFTMGQSIITYISNGIAFNAKYVFSNVAVLSAVYGLDFATKKISALLKMKKEKVLVSSI